MGPHFYTPGGGSFFVDRVSAVVKLTADPTSWDPDPCAYLIFSEGKRFILLAEEFESLVRLRPSLNDLVGQ
jgi:hypothetical protein